MSEGDHQFRLQKQMNVFNLIAIVWLMLKLLSCSLSYCY